MSPKTNEYFGGTSSTIRIATLDFYSMGVALHYIIIWHQYRTILRLGISINEQLALYENEKNQLMSSKTL